jgi:Domain of unknown function (DUF5753)
MSHPAAPDEPRPSSNPGAPESRPSLHPGRLVTASYLRTLRIQHDLPCEKAAPAFGIKLGALSRIEGWLDPAPWSLTANLLELYGAGDLEQLKAVRALTDDAQHAASGVASDMGLGWQDRLAAVESHASRLVAVGASTFPGVLWSAAYAEAVAAAQPLYPVLRSGLAPDHRGRIVAVIPETALHLPFGGPQVMADQLARVVGLIDSGRAHVQLLPMAAGLAFASITELHVSGHVLYAVQNAMSGVFYCNLPQSSAAYREELRAAQSASLPPERSRDLLVQAHRVYAAGRHGSAIAPLTVEETP